MDIKRIISLILVLFVFLTGCNKATTVNESNKISVAISQTDMSEAEIYYFTNGNFDTDFAKDSAMVVVDSEAKAHIVMKSNNTTYTLFLEDVEREPFNVGELISADVDNDGVDELLFWGEINGNGYTIARIFKLIDGEIKLIFDLNERADVSYFYIKNKELLIDANVIGYSQTIDISKEFSSNNFDSNGKYTGSSTVIELPIRDLSVVTTDEEKNNTILCFSRGLKINSYLGDLKIFLNYDKTNNQLRLYEISFEKA